MRVFAILLVASLAGCASSGNPIKELWVPHTPDLWAKASVSGLKLHNRDGSTRFIEAKRLSTLVAVKDRLEKVSGEKATLALVETEQPNAFAFQYQGRPVIAVSLSWLDLFSHDSDAIATTLGHELAHLHLGHSGAARKERADKAKAGGQVVGVLIGLAGVPMGGTIGSLGASAYANSFSRDEERAADDLGLKWAADAGYDPCGKVRVVKAYEKIRAGSVDIPFLDTHPGYSERAKVASEMAALSGRPHCQE